MLVNQKWITDENNLLNVYYPKELIASEALDIEMDYVFIENFLEEELDQYNDSHHWANTNEVENPIESLIYSKENIDFKKHEYIEDEHVYENEIDTWSVDDVQLTNDDIHQLEYLQDERIELVMQQHETYNYLSDDKPKKHTRHTGAQKKSQKIKNNEDAKEVYVQYHHDNLPCYKKVNVEKNCVRTRVYYRQIIRIRPVVVRKVEKHVYKHVYKSKRIVVKDKNRNHQNDRSFWGY